MCLAKYSWLWQIAYLCVWWHCLHLFFLRGPYRIYCCLSGTAFLLSGCCSRSLHIQASISCKVGSFSTLALSHFENKSVQTHHTSLVWRPGTRFYQNCNWFELVSKIFLYSCFTCYSEQFCINTKASSYILPILNQLNFVKCN